MKEKNASGKRVFQGCPSNDFHPRDTRIVLEIVVIDRNYFYCYQNVGSASKKRMVIRYAAGSFSLSDKHYPQLRVFCFFISKKLCVYIFAVCVFIPQKYIGLFYMLLNFV